jgi:hypothetical protein
VGRARHGATWAHALLLRAPSAALAALRRLVCSLRMPGAFADAALEADWLAEVSAQRAQHDTVVFAFSALIHAVQTSRQPALAPCSAP